MITDWNNAYQKRPYREQEPHPGVVRLLETLKQAGNSARVLDLGCGDGRHLVFLAQNGLIPLGVDLAFWGLRRAREWAARQQLESRLVCADVKDLPLKTASFDTVISIQVIHHQRLHPIHQTISQVHRLLRTGGYFYFSVPKYPPENWKDKQFEEIEAHTYVPMEGFESGLPHHFFTLHELRAVLADFEILELAEDINRHWAVLARKRK